jgi:hypothetical protein
MTPDEAWNKIADAIEETTHGQIHLHAWKIPVATILHACKDYRATEESALRLIYSLTEYDCVCRNPMLREGIARGCIICIAGLALGLSADKVSAEDFDIERLKREGKQ